MPKDHETYLGDGVYASYDGYQISLWTSNGIRKSEPIAIEPQTYNKLIDFAAAYWNMAKNGKVER